MYLELLYLFHLSFKGWPISIHIGESIKRKGTTSSEQAAEKKQAAEKEGQLLRRFGKWWLDMIRYYRNFFFNNRYRYFFNAATAYGITTRQRHNHINTRQRYNHINTRRESHRNKISYQAKDIPTTFSRLSQQCQAKLNAFHLVTVNRVINFSYPHINLNSNPFKIKWRRAVVLCYVINK